jgi:multidrug efflux pump subunit AcrA (membrane-fusion protein)
MEATMNPNIDHMHWVAEGVRRYGHYALGGLAAICLMSGNYTPLMESATQRYLESEGKALWQLEERATAARTALQQVVAEVEQALREAEERSRQQLAALIQAVQEQQRLQEERERQAQRQADYRQSYARNLAAFNGIVARYRQDLEMMAAVASLVETGAEERVRVPGFFNNASVTVAEVSSFEPCRNPASVEMLWNLDHVRRHNLFACLVYYASGTSGGGGNPIHRHAISLIFARINSTADEMPIPNIFMYHWYMKIVDAANRGNYVPYPPSLFSGDRLSNSILEDVDAGFVALMNAKATNAEILRLRDVVHPDVVKLSSLAGEMRMACQQLGISPCIPPVIRF